MTKKQKDVRFIRTFIQHPFGMSTEILVDKQTGVNYLYHQSGYGGGLCPLLDKDGKPVITDISSEVEA